MINVPGPIAPLVVGMANRPSVAVEFGSYTARSRSNIRSSSPCWSSGSPSAISSSISGGIITPPTKHTSVKIRSTSLSVRRSSGTGVTGSRRRSLSDAGGG